MLLPCRHVFAANMVRWPNAELFRVSQCHRRWTLDKPVAVQRVALHQLSQPKATAAVGKQSGTELSSNQLHVNLLAAAARLSSFLQPHGQQAYSHVQQAFDQFIDHYSKTAPPRGAEASVSSAFASHPQLSSLKLTQWARCLDVLCQSASSWTSAC